MAEIDILARLKLSGEGFNREFKQNMSRMESDAKASSSRIKSAFSGLKTLGAGLIAGIGVSTFVNLAKDGLEYASSLGEVSQQLGVSSKALQEYRYIGTQVGIDQAKIDASLQRLTKSIGEARGGSKKLSGAFTELKVELTDANGKTRETGDVLRDLVKGFSDIQDPAKRARLETTLFGKAGQQLDTLLAGGVDQVDNLRKAAHDLGIVLSDKQIENADRAADNYAKLKTVMSAQIAGVVSDNIESLNEIADALANIASKSIKAVGEYLKFQRLFSSQQALIKDAGQRIDAMRATPELKAQAKTRARQMILNDTSDVVAQGWFGTIRELKEKPKRRGGSGALATGGASALSGLDFDEIARLAEEEKALKAVASATIVTTKTQRGLRAVFSDVDKELAASIPKYGELAQEVEGILDGARRDLDAFYDKIGVFPIDDLKKIVEAIDQKRDAKQDDEVKHIEHTADLREDTERDLADMYETLFTQGTGAVWKDFKRQGMRMIAQIAAQYTMALLSGQQVSLPGLLGGSGIGGAQGGAGGLSQLAGLGAQAGPIGIGIALNQGISKLLGNDQRKNGMLASLLVGPFLASVITKAKKGSATLGFTGGELGVGSSRGNSQSRIAAAKGGIGAVADNLQQIADALGGTISGAGSVSLGLRKKSYRVDPTGQGRTKGAGVLDFGKDEEAAIRAATLDALKDGVIAGISDASKRILQSGKDLEKSITKAALIESIPKTLKARLDPVGAALDEVNARWKEVKAALDEGGASAQQFADAQKLYNLELADAKAVSNGAREGLKEFLDSLNFGSSSPLALRDQEAAAKAVLQPFLDQISAGGPIDQAAYQAAAGSYLDIERQINGSTRGFFAEFEKIQAATAQAIASIDAAAPIRTPQADVFAQATANATQQTADSNLAIANMTQQQLDQLSQIRTALNQMAAGGGFGGSFIGANRNFA